MPETSDDNHAIFRDCLSATLLASQHQDQQHEQGQHTSSAQSKSQARKRRRGKAAEHQPSEPLQQEGLDANDDLADFIDYLAADIFAALPPDLQNLTYRSHREAPAAQQDLYALPLTASSLAHIQLPPHILESLTTYRLLNNHNNNDDNDDDETSDQISPHTFLIPILTPYLTTVLAPPPATQLSRTDACELCERDHVPLSYHHLVPRFVHDKAVKRGWHRREDLQNVAWLCGACHRFVHQAKTHEELARDFYTVDKLLEVDEIVAFAKWAHKLRWKGR